MSLNPGTRLGSYEVVEALGAGAMGEVYGVRDPRLDRIVALKVVRTDFSERLERGAKTISRLSHAFSCSLYDVGSWVFHADPGSVPVVPLGTASTVDPAGEGWREAVRLRLGQRAYDEPERFDDEDVTVAALTGARTVVGTLQ